MDLNRRKSLNVTWALGFRIFFALLALYAILITAWVGDDIQITFRQVWNFINGDGITFNYGQRVQAFTHPLWFFTLSIVSFFTGELFLSTIILCTMLSILAVILLFRIEFHIFQGNLPVISPIYALLFSWAFVEYSTSGLENALSYFLTGILLSLFLSKQFEERLNFAYLVMALMVLNRFDYGILFLPLALVFIPSTQSIRGFLKAVWPGVLLLAIWLAFATFYFGSPMPNTFYAKLHADYPVDEVLYRGGRYFLALRQDHATTLIIASGIMLSFASMNRILIALAIGQLAYCIYIFQIGGDFMQGRFFALPAFLSMGQIILAFAFKKKWRKNYSFRPVSIFLTIAIVTGVFTGFPFMSTTEYKSRKAVTGILDERGGYYGVFGLFSANRTSWPAIAYQADSPPNEYRLSDGHIGGFALLDTSYHLIDTAALTDPFLSRLPAIRTENWQIGHHNRKVPKEYGEYLIGNEVQLPDSKLNGLLRDVELASRSDLFTTGRFGAILRLNSNFHTDNIDFSEYQDPNTFISLTDSVETVTVKNWDSPVEFEKSPIVYQYGFRRFNDNIKFVSEISEIADAIRIATAPFHTYEIYVNDMKIPGVWPKETPKSNYHAVYHTIGFDEPILLKSVKLMTVGVNYDQSPPFNQISQISLLLNRK